MDNDILIDQARQLYVALYALQALPPMENKIELDRLEHLIMLAYCRYQRRLNRCVLCYQHRTYDCIREHGKKSIPCARRTVSNQTAA
jgi:hypothetical protein